MSDEPKSETVANLSGDQHRYAQVGSKSETVATPKPTPPTKTVVREPENPKDPAIALAALLVSMGSATTTLPVKYADMDFVVTVSRKQEADNDAEEISRLKAAEAKMRATLTHLAIIGERCDVRAAATKALET